MKRCYSCKEEKSEDSFYKGKYLCKVCSLEERRTWRRANPSRAKQYKVSERSGSSLQEKRKYLVEYLRNHPCIDCGERDLLVLEFDHTSGIKRRGVRDMVTKGYSLGALKDEISKCEIRCRNCHARRHYKEQNCWLLKYIGT